MAAALLDVVFALVVIATLVIAMLTVLNDGAQDRLARAYARQFAVAKENDCPAAFGKPFWFSCASEVRQMRGADALVGPPAPVAGEAQAAALPPPKVVAATPSR